MFQSWNGQALPATVTTIAHLQQTDHHYITMTMLVKPEQMAKIFQEQWFHVNEYALLNDVSFNSNGDIELQLVLNASITHQLAANEIDTEAILLSVIPEASDARVLPTLSQAELWYITEAMQQLSLPVELAQEGHVRHGFRTIWRKELLHLASARDQQAWSSSTTQTLAEQVEDFLIKQELKYDFHNEQLVRLKLHTKNNSSWTELIRIEEDAKLIIMYAVFPTLVMEQNREALALQFMNENYDLMNGAFEMDSSDGELRFRSSLLCSQGVDAQSLLQLLHDHVQVMEHYMSSVEQF